jgi:hypothetical protein
VVGKVFPQLEEVVVPSEAARNGPQLNQSTSVLQIGARLYLEQLEKRTV